MADLVIGGTGFVGRNLVRRLTAAGRDVVVLDRVDDPKETSSVRFIQADAQDADRLDEVLREVQPEDVYHLAANSDISAGVADASLDFGDTLMTTVAVRYAMERTPARRLVFASSSAIFGAVEYALGEELLSAPAPASWYGKAKLASEFVLESLAAVVPGMPILVVRFPNVVGPLATHGVVFDFVRKLRADPTRLEVLGDGHQTKPYVHVSDLLDGIAFFLDRASGLSRVNLGPVDQVDVRTIAAEVCQALGVNPDIAYGDTPFGWPGDVPRYAFDTAKMQREGFSISATSREAVARAASDLAQEWPPR